MERGKQRGGKDNKGKGERRGREGGEGRERGREKREIGREGPKYFTSTMPLF